MAKGNRRLYEVENPEKPPGRRIAQVAAIPGWSVAPFDAIAARLDARGFLRHLTQREAEAAHLADWPNRDASTALLSPVGDPDEINRFLCRPLPVSLIELKPTTADTTAAERIADTDCATAEAKHALRLGMILVAIDPHTPHLARELRQIARDIRRQTPLPAARRGKPKDSGDVPGLQLPRLEMYRKHRILALHDLLLKGHDPKRERKQMACSLFPEKASPVRRAAMFDRARELLDEALGSLRMIDAQTR